ncbi:DUF421 domain-containing protein [Jeotgalibacillus proteolyticus]|uniref:YetF C-terminal domain-containing protein n=1 Tax=Jeotgalibacillus proteolyticus TaxID=2082395 RepID=A0A2S5GFX7_9BACL|nr:DUF421 domain-containing protein [Jeotgalibacillus proteolyticus]PPA71783.1 hypothetical protein C4B60_05525 [Jeotgalibacillus proteolyticus]
MEEYILITFRTIVLYGLIILIFRLMGKREVGELSLLDLIVFMMIGEVAVLAIEDPYVDMLKAVFPMVLLMVLQVMLSWFSLKNKTFRDLIDGTPSVLVRHGRLMKNEMRRNRYNIDDLMQQLRDKDIFDMNDVEFAILEPSGMLTVLKKGREEGKLSLPLIMDGQIQYDHLKKLHKDEPWLRAEMEREGYSSLEKILFCSYENGQWYISGK